MLLTTKALPSPCLNVAASRTLAEKHLQGLRKPSHPGFKVCHRTTEYNFTSLQNIHIWALARKLSPEKLSSEAGVPKIAGYGHCPSFFQTVAILAYTETVRRLPLVTVNAYSLTHIQDYTLLSGIKCFQK